MTGWVAPPRESEPTFPAADLSIFLGLITAFGVFLFLAFRHVPDSPAPVANVGDSQAGQTLRVDLPISKGSESPEAPTRKPEQRSFSEPAIVQAFPESDLVPVTFESEQSVELPTIATLPLPPLPSEMAKVPIPERPQPMTETELALFLRDVPFVGLDPVQSRRALLAIGTADPSIGKSLRGPEKSVLALVDENKINGLPFAESQDCQLDPPQAVVLDKYSRLLREQILFTDKMPGRNHRSRILSDRDQALVQALKTDRKWQSADAIPAMTQILQVESLPVRLQLVEWLQGFDTPEATQALLNRAVFDISSEVRLAANTALKRLYHVGYRRQLLDALRHPWPEVAWNAAQTLIAVDDQGAVAELSDLLSAPDPTFPYPDQSGNMVKREMVGIQHAQNCLLCHAPSRSKTDPVRSLAGTFIKSSPLVTGSLPTLDMPLYYQGRGPGMTAGLTNIDIMVRADVTYLRQDFSAAFIQDKDEFPRIAHRVDYLLRTRPATPEEIAQAERQSAEKPLQYPQRNAVLHALRTLESKNLVAQSKN